VCGCLGGRGPHTRGLFTFVDASACLAQDDCDEMLVFRSGPFLNHLGAVFSMFLPVLL